MNIYKQIESLAHEYSPDCSQDIIDNCCVRFELDSKEHLMSLMGDISKMKIDDDLGPMSFTFSLHTDKEDRNKDRFFLFLEEW